MTIMLIYLHITYVSKTWKGVYWALFVTRQLTGSYQIRLTRTGEHQHGEISLMGRLTSSADESEMFDLPP